MKTIIDLHQDLLLHVTRRDLFPEHMQTSFEMLKEANIKICTVSAFPVPENGNFFDTHVTDMLEEDLRTYVNYTKTHPEFVLIRTKDDLKRVLKTDGLFGLILHIEGLNVFDEKNGWKHLSNWYDIGLRSIGPVWNHENPFGGGDKSSSDIGLSKLGKDLVSWCEEKGVVLDLAHMNEKTFDDVTKITKRPLFVSHGNAKNICPSPRNYSDTQLKTIANSGGVIGVFFSKKFLSQEGGVVGIDTVHAHIEHMVNIAGRDAIALGSDFGGILSGFPEGLDSVMQLQRFIENLPNGIQDYFSNKNAQRILEVMLAPSKTL